MTAAKLEACRDVRARSSEQWCTMSVVVHVVGGRGFFLRRRKRLIPSYLVQVCCLALELLHLHHVQWVMKKSETTILVTDVK